MFELTKFHKQELILGLEIRDKVVNYAGEKINSLRNNSGFQDCLNIGVLRTNAMKSLHNYFRRESVSILAQYDRSSSKSDSSFLLNFSWTSCSSASLIRTSRRVTIVNES